MDKYELIEEIGNEIRSVLLLKKAKYPFKKEYIRNLIAKYKANPGKYEIHLNDLPECSIIEFNDEGNMTLKKTFDTIKEGYSLDKINKLHKVNFYSLKDFIERKQSGLTIKKVLSFKRFLDENGIVSLDITELEKTVISIKMFPQKMINNSSQNKTRPQLSQRRQNISGLFLMRAVQKGNLMISHQSSL